MMPMVSYEEIEKAKMKFLKYFITLNIEYEGQQLHIKWKSMESVKVFKMILVSSKM